MGRKGKPRMFRGGLIPCAAPHCSFTVSPALHARADEMIE
jgi:hypothetical protein